MSSGTGMGSVSGDTVESAAVRPPRREGSGGRIETRDSALGTTGNYPPPGDNSTSSGGYGSTKNVWSDNAQRGNVEKAGQYGDDENGSNSNKRGLIDQSTSGTDLSNEMQDAQQGRDKSSVDVDVN